MRYNQIRECDIANGEGIGVALFVQGCHFHCHNCFNQETWDFNGGKEWTPEIESKLLELVNRPYVKRISILGGEPLADSNLDGILHLVDKLRLFYPNKSIWLYTGYTWEQIFHPCITDNFDMDRDKLINKRIEIVTQCNILIDGRYDDSRYDITLQWRGSSNQRIILVKESLKKGEIVLWTE